jgi:hypothetical protein
LGPWFVPKAPGWAPGEVVTSPVHGGQHSLHAALRGASGTTEERRWGALYEVGAVPLPNTVSLWYRVDTWRPAGALQYLLFAVMVGFEGRSEQIRYFLAGPEAIPYNEQGNMRFVLVSKGAPALGRWVRFQTNLHQDFAKRWGHIPHDFTWLRFAIEARYDTRGKPLDQDATADVFYDDVYIGD